MDAVNGDIKSQYRGCICVCLLTGSSSSPPKPRAHTRVESFPELLGLWPRTLHISWVTPAHGLPLASTSLWCVWDATRPLSCPPPLIVTLDLRGFPGSGQDEQRFWWWLP